MKVLLIVLGALLIAMSLMLLLVNPIIGIAGIALGIFAFWYSKKYKKKMAADEAVVEQPQTAETEAKAENHPVGEKRETIKVAGITNYTKGVLSLGRENPEYEYSKRDIIENGLENEKIYQYEFRTLPAEFVYEPENEYDSNAIAIYVTGVKIGYVKKGATAHIRNLIESGKLESASCEIVGGNYKRLDPETNTLQKEKLEYGARVTLRIKA